MGNYTAVCKLLWGTACPEDQPLLSTHPVDEEGVPPYFCPSSSESHLLPPFTIRPSPLALGAANLRHISQPVKESTPQLIQRPSAEEPEFHKSPAKQGKAMPGLNPSLHSNILVRCELILWVGLQLTPPGNYIWSVRMCRALGVVGARQTS